MIQIKTLRYDNEYDIKIRIRFQNDLCSSYLDIYAQNGIFTEFAKELIDFPFAKVRTIKFQYGQDDDKWSYYLLIQVDVIDSSGKILIKTLVDNKGDEIDHYRCEIPLITDVITLNQLGKQLLKWTPLENETWTFPSLDNS